MTENERLGQLEICQAKIETQVEQNTKGIEDLKSDNKVIYDIATSVKVMATEMQGMSGQMTEMKDDIVDVKNRVVNVENRPAKDTAEAVQKVKLAVYTAVATFLATGILGGLILFVVK